MDIFELKYFMIFIIIIELMMSYFLISTVYKGYKEKRVNFNKVVLCFAIMIIILLITLAVTVFI